MLTRDQIGEFEQDGIVRIPGAIAKNDADTMCQRVWDFLAREHSIRRDSAETWTVARPAGFNPLERSGAFAAMCSAAVCDALDDLLGTGRWVSPRFWGAPLVTFPEQSMRWTVPAKHWHLDFPAPGIDKTLPGVIVFAFLAPVMPGGGGTVVAAGSHRIVRNLVNRRDPNVGLSSVEVRRILTRSEPWFRALWSPDREGDRVRQFMRDGAKVGGVRARVVEVTGEPGDVTIMHPWMLHAASGNCLETPRMMLRQHIECRAHGKE